MCGRHSQLAQNECWGGEGWIQPKTFDRNVNNCPPGKTFFFIFVLFENVLLKSGAKFKPYSPTAEFNHMRHP